MCKSIQIQNETNHVHKEKYVFAEYTNRYKLGIIPFDKDVMHKAKSEII